jgi:tetratricopeptide (TPR) repeat protein
VFGPQRSPVSQVYVELKNEVNSVVGRVRTEGSGRFTFTGLANGRYTLTVLPLGTDFEEQTIEVELSGVGARGIPLPDRAQRDFYLRPRRTSSPSANRVLFAQEVPSEAKKLYENAVEALERQQIAQGIEGLEQSLKIFPNYFLALERLGLEELKREKFLTAKKLLGDCVRVNPRSFRCWYGLGYSAYSLQESSDAVDALKKTVEIDASSAASFFVLGLSQRRMGQYQDAEDSMLKAKALDNGRTSAINWNLALLYAHNLKRYKDAAAELELFLEADPKNPDAGNIKKLINQFQNRSTNP